MWIWFERLKKSKHWGHEHLSVSFPGLSTVFFSQPFPKFKRFILCSRRTIQDTCINPPWVIPTTFALDPRFRAVMHVKCLFWFCDVLVIEPNPAPFCGVCRHVSHLLCWYLVRALRNIPGVMQLMCCIGSAEFPFVLRFMWLSTFRSRWWPDAWYFYHGVDACYNMFWQTCERSTYKNWIARCIQVNLWILNLSGAEQRWLTLGKLVCNCLGSISQFKLCAWLFSPCMSVYVCVCVCVCVSMCVHLCVCVCFLPNSKTLLWGLQPRFAPVRSGAASTQGSRQGSAGFQCRYFVRFRKVPVQVEGYSADIWLGSIESFGAATWWDSGGSIGEDAWWGSGGFWGRYIPCEVPEGSGVETLWGSGGFRRRALVSVRRVLAEKMLGEVPEGSGAGTLWSFRGILVQMFFEIPKSWQWRHNEATGRVLESSGLAMCFTNKWRTKRMVRLVDDMLIKINQPETCIRKYSRIEGGKVTRTSQKVRMCLSYEFWLVLFADADLKCAGCFGCINCFWQTNETMRLVSVGPQRLFSLRASCCCVWQKGPGSAWNSCVSLSDFLESSNVPRQQYEIILRVNDAGGWSGWLWNIEDSWFVSLGCFFNISTSD